MSDLSLNPDKIFNKLVTLGDEYADALYAYEMMADTEKSALADLMTRQSGKSNAENETLARASKEFQDRVRYTVELKRDMLKAKVKYDSAKKWADLIQTKAANMRVEYKNAGRMT